MYVQPRPTALSHLADSVDCFLAPLAPLQTLEELDEVFSMSTARQARYGLASPAFWFRKYILRQNIQRTALHHYHPSEHKDQAKMEHREIA